jgi:hypothetical protein
MPARFKTDLPGVLGNRMVKPPPGMTTISSMSDSP